MTDVKVPSVGESITEVFLGAWLKQPGDAVAKDEPLVEVETDKATLEVPAPEAGVLSEILAEEGATAEVGQVIARVDETATGDAAPVQDAPAEDAPADAAPASAPTPEPPAPATGPAGAVMPAAQRLLDAHGLDAAQVPASGPGGRLLKEDVQRHLDAQGTTDAASTGAPATAPTTAAAVRGEEAVPMSPLRRTIARRLVEAQQTAALLTTFNEVDMSAVMALRSTYKDAFEKRYGVRLGFMSFFVKAAIDALKAIPQLNAEIRDDAILYKDYYDVAVAVSTKKGLVTPVVRDAESLSFAEIESTIADFGVRAQANQLTPDELTGGTFTISNGGVFGSLLSTPIVNPPQSGVLGMHSIQQRPVAVDGEVVIRPMMYLALTYDHRIVDGREAVTFLKRIKDAVETPARLLIEV
ncbi:MAG: 2-oxoglutarate dehydrogenase complex dihydrolipoyllysine-residue succinyltransferase [Trueperaceae bacterium]|nr:2-oxoglutarate dehydrogenase complex dihydrolipoyllysine-residue succinyltransferase [Trueperaceae bacterium]